MSETLTVIFDEVWDRLRLQATTYLPSLIAAAILILGAWIVATMARTIIYRIFKGAAIDRFLRRTGVAYLLDPSGRLRARRLIAKTVYWSILTIGVLAGLSVFGTDVTAQLIQSFVLLIPRLVIAGAIILGGVWFSNYLARAILVWAFNENLPYPRRLATSVRVMVVFVAIVVAADHLEFARQVFLTAFVIFVGGLMLTISLAVGIGAAGRVRGYFREPNPRNPTPRGDHEERSLWTHL